MKQLRRLSVFLLLGVILVACGEINEKKVDFVYVDWAEGVAMAHVAKAVLEENGYNVNLKRTDAAPLFASLAKGNADVFLEAWLPVTHKDYMDKYGDQLDEIGTIYQGAKIGLVVPDYVDIESIEELNDHKDDFDGKIVGIDAGAGIMKTTEEAIPEYDLDFDLQTSSESGMTATLKKAIDKKDPVVVTGWKPHWMFSRFEVKMLDDPEGIYGESEKIEALSRKGFSDDQPFVAEFIGNMEYNDDQIGALMEKFEEIDNEEDAAKEWIKENRDLVDSWVPESDEKESEQ